MRLRRLLLFLLLPFPALAQTGSIRGTLSDASTKRPLVDVRVTATSPSLEVAQVTVTDGQGAYRIAALPPGLYVLTFQRSSFQPHTRTRVPLRAQATLRVDVALLPEGVVSTLPMYPAPTPSEQGCTGLVGDTCAAHLDVARAEPLNATVRTFVPLAELAPRSDVTVYAASGPAQSVFIPAKKQMREP